MCTPDNTQREKMTAAVKTLSSSLKLPALSLISLLALLLVVPSSAYPGGAEEDSCRDLRVRHVDNTDESTEGYIPSLLCIDPCPYQLRLVGVGGEPVPDGFTTYQCGALHEFELTASEGNIFQGYLLQARVSATDQSFSESSEIVGTFETNSTLDPWHTINCSSSSDTATHNDAVDTNSVTFFWRAPSVPISDEQLMDLNNVTFWYTIAESYTTYYEPQPGPMLVPDLSACAPMVCEEDTFTCERGDNVTCIPLSSVCDGRSDCADNSDESDCNDLMISPSEVITIEGEDIQVLCTPFRPELPSILEIRVPGIVDEFTPVLRLMGFLNVSTSDAGTLFTLLSSNIERSLNGAQLRCLMGERTSGFANLTVFYPPTYSSVSPVSVLAGSNVLVELVFDSLPTPATVEWFFNGLPLEEGGGVRFGAGFIEIESVSLEQSGEYRVEASNIAGVGGTTLQLNVTDVVRPMIGFDELEYGVNEGDGDVTITVSILSGQFGPSVTLNVSIITLSSGSAGAGVDYFGSLMSLTLSDLIRSGSITFTIVDDDLREGEESFTVVISSVLPLGVAETPAQYASTTVRITDDDQIFADCACSRDIVCSIAGEFSDGGSVALIGQDLKCTISLDALDRQTIRVDPNFATDFAFLSAGSLAFVRQLDAVPREAGFTSCAIEQELDQLSDPSIVLESLGVSTLGITYLQEDNVSFNNFRLDTLELREIALTSNFTLRGELGTQNACSFQHLAYWLTVASSFPESSQCVNNDGITNIVFTVEC